MMPRYLFPLLLLFFMAFCMSCKAENVKNSNESFELFKSGMITALTSDGSGNEKFMIRKVFLASFGSTNDTMVALFQSDNVNTKRETFAKFIDTQGEDWGEKVMEGNGKNWKTQFVLKEEEKMSIFASAMVVKDDMIYLLFVSEAQSKTDSSLPNSASSNKKLDFNFFHGTIVRGGNSQSEKRIEWKKQKTPAAFLADELQEKLGDFTSLEASAFLVEQKEGGGKTKKNEALVFVIKAEKKLDNNEEIFLFAHSKNTNAEFEISFFDAAASCCFKVFSWDEKLLMISQFPDDDYDGKCKLQESTNMGKTWGNASGPLAATLNELEGENPIFATITIDNKRVLLFVKEKMEFNAKPNSVHYNLFMFYNNCITNLGQILSDVYFLSHGFVLYTNDELFLLSQISFNEVTYKIIIKRIETQLENIKLVFAQNECIKEMSEEIRKDLLTKFGSGKLSKASRRFANNSTHLSVNLALVFLLLCVLFIL